MLSNVVAVLNGKGGVGKCLAGTTTIYDPVTGAPTPLQEVITDDDFDAVLTYDPTVAAIKPTPIGDKINSGTQPVFTVTSATGRQITATGTHPFLTRTGWVPLACLPVGTEIALAAYIPEPLAPIRRDHEMLTGLAQNLTVGPVPNEVFQLPDPDLTVFLTALWDRTDTLDGADHTVGEGLQHLMLRLGIQTVLARTQTGWSLSLHPAHIEAFNTIQEHAAATIGAAPGSGVAVVEHGPVFWDHVVSVTAQGSQQVWDLSVPATECFVADGYVVHNSTTAAHLAGIAAAQGWRTLVVDCDAQGNLHRNLGFDYDAGEHLRDTLDDKVALSPRSDRRDNLDYVGGGELIEDATARLKSRAAEGDPKILYRLQDILAPVAGNYDLIVVDSPPREMFLRRMILMAAHYLVVPVDKDEAAFDGLASVLKSVGEARNYGNSDLEILGVLRFRIGSEAMSKEIAVDVAKILGTGDLTLRATIRNALRAASDLRERSLLAHEYEEQAKSAIPWFMRRRLGAKAAGEKRYSSAATGLAEDWWGAVSEILDEFRRRAIGEGEVAS